MGVLLQGFFKLAKDHAVPSPADGDASVAPWWDHLAAQANALSLSGFTAVWLPPVLKTADGAKPKADGYGPFDDYDIGSRNQKGSVSTRFGSRAELQRCVAILRANGIEVYLDMVEHHRAGDGGDNTPEAFVFRYPGANTTPLIGRFPKNPDNFFPHVPRDPHLGGPVADDRPFARELAPINAKPLHYVRDNLISAADWLTRALDVQGYRLDDVKGLSTDFLLPFLNSRSMAGKFAAGEFFDGNRLLVNGWIFNPKGMQGRPNAFDFPLKFLLNAMCNHPGRFNMSDLDHAGLTGISPLNSVTFVENHDTDLDPNNRITTNKLLGYAYTLTSEGYPAVFYRDYSTDPNCYGLKERIDNLIWIHEVLANGPTQQRWKDFDVFAYERMAGSHLLVGLNNDPDGGRTIHVDTGFGANVALHDYTGHGPDVTTGGDGSVTITVPQNVNGLGYVCYSRAGQDRPLPTSSHAVTQDFEGADDLDILPVIDGKTVTAGEIWCAAKIPVRAVLTVDRTGWTAASKIDVSLVFPDQTKADLPVDNNSPVNPELHATTTTAGFYQLELTAANLPATRQNLPYKISVTYSATQTLAEAKLPAPALAQPAKVGQWTPIFDLENVAVHAHLLPTGKVLYWGRRDEVGSQDFTTLNEHHCTTFLWDPATQTSRKTKNQPTLADGKTTVNLFCSGHCFLADGRLMVVGGHLFDSQGVNQACVYDPATDLWTGEALMNKGRWYPSALTLPDGGVMALSGTFAIGAPHAPPQNPHASNQTPQVWRGIGWESMTDFDTLTLFPRFHVAPNGRVFMSGGLGQSYFFDLTGNGTWIPIAGAVRAAGLRDYAPSVMYDTGKVAFIGGGLDSGTQAATNMVEIIDLNVAAPTWQQTTPMHFARRQHNASILPDGSIFVSGGTKGDGFNALDHGAPVHTPEIWNPISKNWTIMADENEDRCYHSISLLLPDGRVLSAGGGEYAPNSALPVANPAKDSHRDAQVFSPPYLFAGPRPVIAAGAPTDVSYGQAFDVQVDQASQIEKVSWIRLGSVTHSFDQNQRLNLLTFVKGAGKLTITAPPNAKVCPPGHYMLFVLNENDVPSVAHILRVSAPHVAAAAVQGALVHNAVFNVIKPGPVEKDALIIKSARRPPVTVGITPACPYGIGSCWGGARDALQRLTGVETVLNVANSFDSTADLYLKDDSLPDLALWRQEFAQIVHGSYVLRGIEMTLRGSIQEDNGLLILVGQASRPEVLLAPMQANDKVQWDFGTKNPRPLLPNEAAAYQQLAGKVKQSPLGTLSVTGPLHKNENGFFMEVRHFA